MSVALAIWSCHVGGDAEPNLNLSFVYTRSHLAVWRCYRSTTLIISMFKTLVTSDQVLLDVLTVAKLTNHSKRMSKTVKGLMGYNCENVH